MGVQEFTAETRALCSQMHKDVYSYQEIADEVVKKDGKTHPTKQAVWKVVQNFGKERRGGRGAPRKTTAKEDRSIVRKTKKLRLKGHTLSGVNDVLGDRAVPGFSPTSVFRKIVYTKFCWSTLVHCTSLTRYQLRPRRCWSNPPPYASPPPVWSQGRLHPHDRQPNQGRGWPVATEGHQGRSLPGGSEDAPGVVQGPRRDACFRLASQSASRGGLQGFHVVASENCEEGSEVPCEVHVLVARGEDEARAHCPQGLVPEEGVAEVGEGESVCLCLLVGKVVGHEDAEARHERGQLRGNLVRNSYLGARSLYR